jgi:dephospho-CoA kinase
MVLGVTGGVASGKSTVSAMLEEKGIPAVDFDRLSREVVEPGSAALKEIVGAFGEKILLPSGRLDRRELSRIVFSDSDKRRQLEAILHPPIIAAYWKRLSTYREDTDVRIVQAVIPLLYELDLQHLVHQTLVVYIPRALQIERLIRRDRIDAAHARGILSAQMPIEEKRKRADYVIVNDGSPQETEARVAALVPRLHSAAEGMIAAGTDQS